MRTRKKRIVFLSFFMFFLCLTLVPQDTFAICPYDYESKYKKMATNVNYDLSYVEENDQAIFQVRFSNVTKELIIADLSTGKEYFPNNGEVIISNLKSGTQYNFLIKSSNNVENGEKIIYIMVDGKKVPGYTIGNDQNCSGLTLQKIYITTPSYNKYYNDPLCEGLQEYQICKKWNKNNYTYDEFKSEVEKIKNPEKEKKPEKKIDTESDLIEILRNNIYMICIIIVILFGIIYYVYQRKKGDDFEGW